MEPPREIHTTVEEWLVEAEGRRYGYHYAVLRSKDTGEYVFWMSERPGFEGLAKAVGAAYRYRDYDTMMEGVCQRFELCYRYGA